MKTLLLAAFTGTCLALAGCAEGPAHYTEGGEYHGNTPHNDDARTKMRHDDEHDRDRGAMRDGDDGK